MLLLWHKWHKNGFFEAHNMKKIIDISLFFAAFIAFATVARGQQSFSIQIIADNDFAVFGGTATSVKDLIYQNDYSWPDQLSNLSTISFDLQAGDTTFYLLGMGGGGDENISGTINGVDITTINVSMSSDLGPSMTDYEAQNNNGTVAEGTYDASLADVQTAFPNLTWTTNLVVTYGGVAAQSPNGRGFGFPSSTAHLFAFDATAVGVTPTPEPSICLLLAVAGVMLAANRFRKSPPSCAWKKLLKWIKQLSLSRLSLPSRGRKPLPFLWFASNASTQLKITFLDFNISR
jgi:hypothetical protein